jgi:hypothetical protein
MTKFVKDKEFAFQSRKKRMAGKRKGRVVDRWSYNVGVMISGGFCICDYVVIGWTA